MAYGVKTIDRMLMKAFYLVGLISIGVMALVGAIAVGEISVKKLVFISVGAALPFLAFLSRQPKAVFLFLWVFALTYNRMYFSFDSVIGNYGSQGLYWIPADAFLVALLLLWLAEAVMKKELSPNNCGTLWPWLLPFAAAGLFSILLSENKIWGLFEMFRLLKVAVILLYFRFNVRKIEWWACISAIGLSIVLQSLLGATQVAMKNVTGVLSLIGAGSNAGAGFEDIGSGALGGWIRAAGTLTHPSNLACYLLLTVPLFLALGIAVKRPFPKALCALTGLTGLAGLALTLSRAPAGIAMMQGLALLVGLTYLGVIRFKQSLGLFFVCGFLLMLAVIPFTTKIMDRIYGDLGESISFRSKYNSMVLQMSKEAPVAGVGLNNFITKVIKYDPEMEWAVANEEFARKTLNIRAFASPHNFYFLLLAETGMAGVLGFAIYLAGILAAGIRAIHSTGGVQKAACYGLMLGVLGILTEQMLDFSLWVDPLLYTFTAVAGLLNNASVLNSA